MGKKFTDMLSRRHKRIKIDTGTPANSLMEFRVDVVRSALERLHPVALLGEQRHQPSGNSCLTRATRGRSYQKCRLHAYLTITLRTVPSLKRMMFRPRWGALT